MTRCSRKVSSFASMSSAAPLGSKLAASCGTSRPSVTRSDVDADAHRVTPLVKRRGDLLGPVDRGGLGDTRRPPLQHRVDARLDQELLDVAAVRLQRRVPARRSTRSRSRSSREPTIPASSSTGTVSDATSAVDTPRPPIPFSAATCRCARLVDEAVRERLVVLAVAVVILRHLGPDQRQHQRGDGPVHVLAAGAGRPGEQEARLHRAGRHGQPRVVRVGDRHVVLGGRPPVGGAAQHELRAGAVLLVHQAEQVEQGPARVQLGGPTAAQAVGERRRHQHQRVDLHLHVAAARHRVGDDVQVVVEDPGPGPAGHRERDEDVHAPRGLAAQGPQVLARAGQLAERPADLRCTAGAMPLVLNVPNRDARPIVGNWPAPLRSGFTFGSSPVAGGSQPLTTSSARSRRRTARSG